MNFKFGLTTMLLLKYLIKYLNICTYSVIEIQKEKSQLS